MTYRPSHLHLRIGIVLGLLLLVCAAGVAAAASVTFPTMGTSGHTGESGGVAIGDGPRFSLPVGSLDPGQKSRGRQVVLNDERAPLRYALRSASINDDHKSVREALEVTIRTADLGTGSAGTCDRFDGTKLYDGPLGADRAGFGDVQMGSQPGDRILGPGEREALCIEIRMRSDAGNEYQGATTSTTWTIAAEQEAGNP
ncbi:MAG TPA: hypothetical protein VNM34_05295 [Verrucomicrobiae bacterium]|jgi:hypothetical protein|nr:hypothetical protein [Verrucomicrobiae bacterium]